MKEYKYSTILMFFTFQSFFTGVYGIEASDRQTINSIFSHFVPGTDKLEKYEEKFSTVIILKRTKYILELTLKSPLRLMTRIHLERSPPRISSDPIVFPKFPKLTNTQLSLVDEVFKKEAKLWMLTTLNSRCVGYDLTKGYKDIPNQKLIFYSSEENKKQNHTVITYFNTPHAVIIYEYRPGNYFSIWVDLKKKEIKGANWVNFSSEDRGEMLTKEDFKFIDSSFKKKGDFGVYGNIKKGLAYLCEHSEVKLYSIKENKWRLSISPLDGHGHHFSFTIDKKGIINSTKTGHSIPAPPPKRE